MANIVLPDEITIQLVNKKDQAIALENVLFKILIFARHKNDFSLGPYKSDSSGKVTITKDDLRHEVAATYDSGLMDYAPVEDAYPSIEIRPYQQDEIERYIKSRTTAWTSLLKGEKERWDSIDELIDVFKNSTNHTLKGWKLFAKIKDVWDGSRLLFHYDFKIKTNN